MIVGNDVGIRADFMWIFELFLHFGCWQEYGKSSPISFDILKPGARDVMFRGVIIFDPM